MFLNSKVNAENPLNLFSLVNIVTRCTGGETGALVACIT